MNGESVPKNRELFLRACRRLGRWPLRAYSWCRTGTSWPLPMKCCGSSRTPMRHRPGCNSCMASLVVTSPSLRTTGRPCTSADRGTSKSSATIPASAPTTTLRCCSATSCNRPMDGRRFFTSLTSTLPSSTRGGCSMGSCAFAQPRPPSTTSATTATSLR